MTLAPDATAPSRARTSLRAFSLGLSPHVLRDVQLVVSELVTNAVEHGPGQSVRVELELRGPDDVCGEVIDEGADGPPHAGSGHLGLRIVDRVAASWKVRGGSTHVWFEVCPRR